MFLAPIHKVLPCHTFLHATWVICKNIFCKINVQFWVKCKYLVIISWRVYISMGLLISSFLLIVMFVWFLGYKLQPGTKQDTQDQVHVSPGMLYNEERKECLMTKANTK